MRHCRLPFFAIAAIAITVIGFAIAKDRERTEVEIGTVKWGRDLNAALESSKESGKPVLVLFQEVPG